MSSQDTSGSNLGGINQQQIAELMQTLGAGKTTETKEVKKETRLPHEKDTASKSEGKAKAKGPDSGKPVLFPPIVGTMAKKGTKEYFSEQLTELEGNMTLEKTEEVSIQVKTYSEQHPGVKLLQKLTGNEAKTIQLLNEALEDEGVTPPVQASHPKFPAALQRALAKIMEEKGFNLPESKAKVYGESLGALKTITDYSAFLQNVDPTNKSYNHGAGLEKVMGMVGSAEELVDGILTQLEHDPNIPKSEGMPILEFLQFIAKLISELKQVLIEMHIQDSKGAGEVGRLTVASTDKKREYIGKQFETMREKLKLQKASKYVQNFMKVLSPILSGLMILTSLIFLPIAPVITVIMISVAITQLAVMTALTETGTMSKIFEGLNKLIEAIGEKVFKGLGIDYESAGDLMKVLVWAGLLTTLVVATLLLTLMPFIGVLIPMVAMPIITTILTESTLVDTLMEALQHVTKMSDKLKMVLTGLVTMVFTLILTLVTEIFTAIGEAATELVKKILGGIFTGGLAIILEILVKVMKGVMAAVRLIVKGIQFIVQTISKIIKFVFRMLKQVMNAMQQIGKATATTLQQIKDFVDKVLKVVKAVIEKFQTAFKKLGDFIDYLKEIVTDAFKAGAFKTYQGLRKIDDVIDDIKGSLDTIKEKMQEFNKRLEKILPTVVSGIHTTGQVTKMSADAISQIGLGAITKRMAKLTEEEGELDYIVKLLAELIKALEALMAKLQGRHEESGVGEFMKQVNELSSLFEQIITSMTGVVDEVAASAVV